MNRLGRQPGAVAVELFLALALLALNGLLIAYVFHQFPDPAPWYAWAAAGAILPVEAIVLAVIVTGIDRRAVREHRLRQGKS